VRILCTVSQGSPAWKRLLQTNRENLKWLVRMALILLLVGVAEILVVLFVPRPLLWVVLIPVLIPLLTSFLITLPMAGAEKTSPSAEGLKIGGAGRNRTDA
jgi:hypothetical protein